MNKLKITLLAIVSAIGLQAQTNKVIVNMDNRTVVETNAPAAGKSESGSYEFTLGAAGFADLKGNHEFGFDFSLSSNFLKPLPNVWLGIAQELVIEPDLAGQTDVTLEYAIHLVGDLWVNPGVFGGIVYSDNDKGKFDYSWHSGPMLTFQYYVGENAFIYAGAQYEVWGHNKDTINYAVGVGISF